MGQPAGTYQSDNQYPCGQRRQVMAVAAKKARGVSISRQRGYIPTFHFASPRKLAANYTGYFCIPGTHPHPPGVCHSTIIATYWIMANYE